MLIGFSLQATAVETPDYAAGLTPAPAPPPTILSGTVATAAALQGMVSR